MFDVRTNFPIQNLAVVCAGVGSLNQNDKNRDRIFFIRVTTTAPGIEHTFLPAGHYLRAFPFKIPRMVDIVMKMVKPSLVHLLSRVIVICHYWIYGAPRRMLKLLLLGDRQKDVKGAEQGVLYKKETFQHGGEFPDVMPAWGKYWGIYKSLHLRYVLYVWSHYNY